ncbi:T9SS type A sorting domain-containing protein [Flavisolibacter tropicus]|uniref:DUF8202 domain-containing protein n=1 Tax=Flavisolibacter tropicus TaxID=1492898 RepID=A0A172U1P0_9BACT|nr:T9SS type A sorting domain-containing protein [Flavisolibacter tropicus]ANE52943.1 hypothetical protein SY85_23165 [Flavisolibacter tropicus]
MHKNLLNLFVYFLFIPLFCFGQGPGGVGVTDSLEMWLRADISSTLNLAPGNLINSWTYANNNTKIFTSTGTKRPLISNSKFNFNPAVTFSGAQELVGPNLLNAPLVEHDDSYTVFAVWKGATSAGFRVWTQWGCVGPNRGCALQTNTLGTKYGGQFETTDTVPYGPVGGAGAGIVQLYTPGNFLITQLNVLNQEKNDLEIIDHLKYGTPTIATVGNNFRDIATVENVLGRRCTVFGEPFSGDVAELIVFGQPISGVKRAKIFSYLAFKYGVMLQTSGVRPSYYASNWDGVSGTVYWSGVGNTAHPNDVFGIGRDDNSRLNQTIANSMNTGSGDGTGQSGKGNIIISNPAHLDNLEFLVIGNNGAVLAEQASDMPTFMTSEARRLSREWKVQLTGDPGPVQLSFDLTGIVTTGSAAQTVMIIDEDGDGNFTTGHVSFKTPTSIIGNRVVFDNVHLANNQVFAFVTKTNLITLQTGQLLLKSSISNNLIQLDWETNASEMVTGYDIEESEDGIRFTKLLHLAVQPPTNGHYSYTISNNPSANTFYRIKEYNQSSTQFFSNIVQVKRVLRDQNLSASPNPFYNKLELHFTAIESNLIKVSITNTDGSVIKTIPLAVKKGNNTINITPYIPPVTGLFIISITQGNQTQTVKVFKNKGL